MSCVDEGTMDEVLMRMPSVTLEGKSFIGRLADPDSYTYRPKRVKVFLYGAPPTMSDEVLKARLSSFGDLESEIQPDHYDPPWNLVQNGNRFVYFKNIFSSAGLPPVLWVNSIRLKIRHRGQERKYEERVKLEKIDQQRIDKESGEIISHPEEKTESRAQEMDLSKNNWHH